MVLVRTHDIHIFIICYAIILKALEIISLYILGYIKLSIGRSGALTRLRRRRLLVHWQITTKNILTAAIICQNPIAAKNLRFVDTRIFDFSFPFILSFFRTEHVLVFRNMLLFFMPFGWRHDGTHFHESLFRLPCFFCAQAGACELIASVSLPKKKQSFSCEHEENEENGKNFSRSHIFTKRRSEKGQSAFPPNGFKMCSLCWKTHLLECDFMVLFAFGKECVIFHSFSIAFRAEKFFFRLSEKNIEEQKKLSANSFESRKCFYCFCTKHCFSSFH